MQKQKKDYIAQRLYRRLYRAKTDKEKEYFRARIEKHFNDLRIKRLSSL